MTRLGVVVTHPIQYYTPLFAYLAKHVDLHVFYGHAPTPSQRGAAGFGGPVDWGIDLLQGHSHSFLRNTAKRPNSDTFAGIDTPHIGDTLRTQGITHLLITGWQSLCYWQALGAALRMRIPVSVRGDSALVASTPPTVRALKRTFFPLFLRRYTRVFYVGARNRAYLAAHGVREQQLAFFPHVVDQAFWTPPVTPRPNEAVRFIWVGKLIDIKRPLDMIAAFARAHATDPSIELTIVGTGPLEGDVRRAAASNSAITLLGFQNQPQLRELYQTAHCLVMTSQSETWGLVVSEALGCELPVIASNGCACTDDLVVGRGTGLTYPIADTVALSDAMLRIATKLRVDAGCFVQPIRAVNRRYHFDAAVQAVTGFLDCPGRRAQAHDSVRTRTTR